MPRGIRHAAQERGDITYYTGVPCKNGHDAPRFTSNGNCVECRRDIKKKHYNSSAGRAYYQEYWKEHYGSPFSCYETWTPEAQRKAEQRVEMHRSWNLSWRKNNPSKAKARKYRVQRATPEWVDFSEMDEIYFQAHLLSQSTGIPHVVDHIEPLYGKTCCGLNVPWNLQALPTHLNREKSNSRTWTHPDYEVPNTTKIKMPGTSPGTFTEILLQGSQSP